LADSERRALRLATRVRPTLRKLVRGIWPGPVTLVFQAVPGLPRCCYRQGKIAVRVDADRETRRLAKLAGGLLLSSSLNRRSGRTAVPGRKLHLRWHRHLSTCLPGGSGSGKASKIILIHGEEIRPIRA
ncbi:MAG TPA: Sua5/YciO/YrdC/YwlC family protein, partial [Mariprofundaceae bacterium]|nr:Sua5/YciO/YrdC/YwlC family protein [Mariprofundaceae bacterium]